MSILKKKKQQQRAVNLIDREKHVKGVHKTDDEKGMSEAGKRYRNYLDPEEPSEHKSWVYDGEEAKNMHRSTLEELKAMPKPKLLAHGGMLTMDGYQSECDAHCNAPCEVHPEASGYAQGDMVGQVMCDRKKMYSMGGKIANEDEAIADEMPNEFDDLHLRDNLEEHYTAANSGDEDGDPDPDKKHNQMVAKVMMKRRKQHNPRPA